MTKKLSGKNVQDLRKAIEKIKKIIEQDPGDSPKFSEVISMAEKELLDQFFHETDKILP